MDAVLRTDVDTLGVFGADTGLANNVGHGLVLICGAGKWHAMRDREGVTAAPCLWQRVCSVL